MAELRSFIVGVVVAGVVLGIIAIALGAFSGDDSDPVVARLLGSPEATATQRATPGLQTTALPTLAATTQPTPTPTESAPEPTLEPTSPPAPEPTVDLIATYIAVINPIYSDMTANIDFVIGQGSANPDGSTQAANTIKALSDRMAAASPPACLTTAHGTLTQGASQAAAAADQLIAALSVSDDGLVQAALGAMAAAQGTLNSGAAAVSSAPC